MTGLFSHSVENVIIPVDELIFFRGIGQPPTRYVINPTFTIIVPVGFPSGFSYGFPMVFPLNQALFGDEKTCKVECRLERFFDGFCCGAFCIGECTQCHAPKVVLEYIHI